MRVWRTCPKTTSLIFSAARFQSSQSGDLTKVVDALLEGRISKTDALSAILTATSGVHHVSNYAKLDLNRQNRAGFPEVVFGSGKSANHLAEIVRSMYESKVEKNMNSTVIATRVSSEQYDVLERSLPSGKVKYFSDSRIAHTINEFPDKGLKNSGSVAVMCAGTSDYPVAEEAAVILELSGVSQVIRVYDVGVAGIHRLLENISKVQACDVVIVCAGMDGALPSVVGGLVKAPVYAVPTSVGYGACFGGVSAMLTMLNSCAPGVSVVNIDNGFGAAVCALKTLKMLGKGE